MLSDYGKVDARKAKQSLMHGARAGAVAVPPAKIYERPCRRSLRRIIVWRVLSLPIVDSAAVLCCCSTRRFCCCG